MNTTAVFSRSLHLGDQPHDARLDGDVERGGRLVGDDQPRLARQMPWRSARAGTCRRRAGADSGAAAPRRRGRCTASSSSSMRSRRSRAATPMRVEMLVELGPMVSTGLSADSGSCGMNAISRPSSARRAPACIVTRSSPSNRRLPPVTAKPGGSSCAMARPTIDLPAPDSPTSRARFPASSANDRSRITGTLLAAERRARR